MCMCVCLRDTSAEMFDWIINVLHDLKVDVSLMLFTLHSFTFINLFIMVFVYHFVCQCIYLFILVALFLVLNSKHLYSLM